MYLCGSDYYIIEHKVNNIDISESEVP